MNQNLSALCPETTQGRRPQVEMKLLQPTGRPLVLMARVKDDGLLDIGDVVCAEGVLTLNPGAVVRVTIEGME